MGIYTEYEMELLNKASVKIENKNEYSNEEKNHITNQIVDYFMSQSTKNDIIGKLKIEYDSIIEKNIVK